MTLFSPLALATSAVVATYFVVAALCGRMLSRGCFGFCTLVVGTLVLGRVPFMGCVACASFSAPLPNTSFQWTAYGSR